MALKVVNHFDDFEMTDVVKAGDAKLIELLVDTKKRAVLHVHPPKGHIKSASEYLGIEYGSINTANAGHLVSAIIQIENNVITGVVIGNSSLEGGGDVIHTPMQLAKAQVLVENLMKTGQSLGEVVLPPDIRAREKIVRRAA